MDVLTTVVTNMLLQQWYGSEHMQIVPQETATALWRRLLIAAVLFGLFLGAITLAGAVLGSSS